MTAETTTLPIETVQLVKELYPRLRPDDAAIERYRAALDLLPPIAVARGHVLVDGFHRWQAHKREGSTTIDAEDLGDLTDVEIIRESYRRNASHGRQLDESDKKSGADRLFRMGVEPDEIRELLSITKLTAEKYMATAVADAKAQRIAKAIDLWLDCAGSNREIAKLVGVDDKSIGNWAAEFLNEFGNSAPPGATKEKPWGNVQEFDVWSFKMNDREGGGAQSYFGAMAPQIVENIVWHFTEPGQVIVDLFAGSGTTIDVGKRMGRRVWASDRRGDTYSPLLPIHTHDVADGWPKAAPKKADLILLDPPYWQQAKGRYSEDPADLANIDYPEFLAAWGKLVRVCRDRLEDGGRMAFIISPTQLDDEKRTVIDHAFDMAGEAQLAGFQTERRVIVTYQTQQATGQQVTWAREKGHMLKLYRDLIVMR